MLIPRFFLLIGALLFIPHVASAQFKDIFKGLDTLGVSESGTLVPEKMIAGLKEALRIGTEKSSDADGNPERLFTERGD